MRRRGIQIGGMLGHFAAQAKAQRAALARVERPARNPHGADRPRRPTERPFRQAPQMLRSCFGFINRNEQFDRSPHHEFTE